MIGGQFAAPGKSICRFGRTRIYRHGVRARAALTIVCRVGKGDLTARAIGRNMEGHGIRLSKWRAAGLPGQRRTGLDAHGSHLERRGRAR